MVQKYFFIAVASISILIVSCRQDDEIIKTEKDSSAELKADEVENQSTSKMGDSIFTGITPKNESHWKLDSIIVSTDPNDPPKNGTHWKETDSTKISDDTTDPPKNGTHWRVKN